MRHAAKLLLVLAVASAGFCYFGMFTSAGARRFDEMDGMIPFLAGVGSGILLLGAFIAWLIGRRWDRAWYRAALKGVGAETSRAAPAHDFPLIKRASFRLSLRSGPNYPAAAVVAALELDDEPLRAAYERVGHTTVADMRERLAEPGDYDRLVWPTYEHYREMVVRSLRRSRRVDRRLLWEQQAHLLERGWRFAGLDFSEVVTRERDGHVQEVEFASRDPAFRHSVHIG